MHPFNICESEPLLWESIKKLFIFSNIFISLLFSNFISSKIFSKKKRSKPSFYNFDKNKLNLKLGYNDKNDLIFISEKSLYQNILITGSIGSGKTSSAMYPLTRQLIEFKSNNAKEKLGMLILDVKGNYYSKILEYTKIYQRQKDLIIIDLSRKN